MSKCERKEIAQTTSVLVCCMGGLLLAACATTRPISPRAAEQFHQVGIGYGVVVATATPDDRNVRRLCAGAATSGNAVSTFCENVRAYTIVTVNVAATTAKSFLKKGFYVPKDTDLKTGDIVKFKFDDADGFIKLVSRGEKADCKWAGSPPWTIGFPFQEGGVECEGWSYKQVLHIDWLKG